MPQLWTLSTTCPAPAFGSGASMMLTTFCCLNAPALIDVLSVREFDQWLGALLLDQFDFVAVGSLDECDHRGAMLHRSRLAHHFDALGLQVRAGLIRIGHADG